MVRFPLHLLCASVRKPCTTLGSVYDYNLFFTGSEWETLFHHFGMKSHRCADLQNVILNIRHNPETMCGVSSSKVGSHLSGDLSLASSNPLEMELSAWSGDVNGRPLLCT